jgi:D-glycero-alpha-D-manno-heptose-7-phosphate kinase
MKLFRARAPLRISFAGGGTDVSPYADERGGLVLNATVDKFAYATLRPSQEPTITIQSLDYHIISQYDLDQPLVYDGKLDLVKAAIRRLTQQDINDSICGFELLLHTDAPPGSGLGSSSALVVAIIGVFCQWLNVALDSYQIASLAYQIEREDLGIKGGRQDQYASAFGGINWMKFKGNDVRVTRLQLDQAIINELHYSLMLFYTGGTRLSAHIIDRQSDGFIQRNTTVVAAMDEVKRLATATKDALVRGDLTTFGHLLHASWESKKKMAETISNPRIDQIYETARQLGALGGKISGAGGGGYMFLYCPFESQSAITEQLEKLGANRVGFGFEQAGLQSWEIDYNLD